MPIPDFVRDLREKIGTAPLWLSGATGGRARRRSDPEAREEANVDIEVERLTSTG